MATAPPGGHFLDALSSVTLAATVSLILTGTEAVAAGASTKQMTLGVGNSGIYTLNYTTGSGTDQANAQISLRGTIASGNHVDIDLMNMSLAGLDEPAVLSNVKSALIQETAGTGTLLVGDATGTLTNAFTGWWGTATSQETVKPLGAISRACAEGTGVTPSTRILRLSATGGNAGYQVDLVGIT